MASAVPIPSADSYSARLMTARIAALHRPLITPVTAIIVVTRSGASDKKRRRVIEGVAKTKLRSAKSAAPARCRQGRGAQAALASSTVAKMRHASNISPSESDANLSTMPWDACGPAGKLGNPAAANNKSRTRAAGSRVVTQRMASIAKCGPINWRGSS